MHLSPIHIELPDLSHIYQCSNFLSIAHSRVHAREHGNNAFFGHGVRLDRVELFANALKLFISEMIGHNAVTETHRQNMCLRVFDKRAPP